MASSAQTARQLGNEASQTLSHLCRFPLYDSASFLAPSLPRKFGCVSSKPPPTDWPPPAKLACAAASTKDSLDKPQSPNTVSKPDFTMFAAEEETLAESGEDLLVDYLHEGLMHDAASSPDHPAAKKPCMDSGAGLANFNSPSASSDSMLAQPAQSPVLPAAAAAAAALATSAKPRALSGSNSAAPNALAIRAAAYAAVASAANPAPALPVSLFASSAPD
ncbi:unnamed protein product [Closterium sp. Yama58-4]|nr:unnamed protein product [Closterium sp. Yama58-4]